MNEQAQKVLADLLQKASNGIDSAVSFSQAQIPDVIHQLMIWNAVSSALAQIFCVFIIIGCFFMTIKAWKSRDYDLIFPSFIAFIIFISGGLIGLFSNFDWLKIWLAPKLYLIEYAANLIK
ncbi:hypothetical protein GMW39_00770 [Pectobacterium parmentieri]|uniref:hypothetical protein n=1 Tax=Pectobacterium parmentieri TaxID=1905730 RepID=UPI001373FAE0|nr:hypothetical protein [Pectobacterium parmentieri]QHQ14541.1 hypothetical protein GMW39_00770 [Pectobacterium parmentieri]QQA77031.1 hypothetical protein JBL47_05360 [Pectobacterium parmentieri]